MRAIESVATGSEEILVREQVNKIAPKSGETIACSQDLRLAGGFSSNGAGRELTVTRSISALLHS